MSNISQVRQTQPASNTSSSQGAATTQSSPFVVGQSVTPSGIKRSSPPNASDPTTANMAVAPPVQLNTPTSDSPANGKSQTVPAVPSVSGGPTIVNGSNPTPQDHNRKPSFQVSSATPGGIAQNGGATNKIQFGDLGSGNSPAPSNPAVLATQSNSSLSVNQPYNARSSSPANTPSPIPQPAVSGGRPPSSLQGQVNTPNFGSFGGDSNDPNRPMSISNNQLGPGGQPIHLRRGSSQSSTGEIQNAYQGPPHRGAFPQGGRGGRAGYSNAYQGQVGGFHSPSSNYRPMNTGRGNPAAQPQFYPQGRSQGPPSSPFPPTRSPAIPNAHPVTPQVQNSYPTMPGQHYPGYPQHMAPNQVNRHSSSTQNSKFPSGRRPKPDNGHSNPRELPPTQHKPPHYSFFPPPVFFPNDVKPLKDLSPESGNFEHLLTLKNQTYGMQGIPNMPAYDPNYPSYYHPTFNAHLNNMNNGMPGQMQFPQSPRPGLAGPQGQFMPPYGGQQPQHQATPISRTSSQMSSTERPASSMGQPPTPSMSFNSQNSQSGNRAVSTPAAPKTQFDRPQRSKAIVIKDPNSGAVKTFEKQPASPARATPSPVKVPTPTPSNRSVSETSHVKTESVSLKTDEEKRKEIIATVQEAKQAAEKQAAERLASQQEAEAQQIKEEAESMAAKEKEELQVKEHEAARVKAEADAEAKRSEEMNGPQAKEEESGKDVPAADKQDDEIDFDALEAEFAAKEAEEAAREAEFQKKRQAEKEEEARKEAEEQAAYEANMKNAEAEAEEAEAAREKRRLEGGSDDEAARKMFAQLKIADAPTPGASSNESPAIATPADSGAATPTSGISMGPPSKTSSTAKRDKIPAALKLEISKPVEPPQPTPAMKSLQSARALQDLSQIAYPNSVASPNPALNQNAPKDRGFKYNKEFLLQFQNIFKEKPSIDWDAKVRDTLGDGGDTSGRPQSARTPSGMGGRSVSNRPPVGQTGFQGMGSFGAPPGARPAQLPPGTTSEQRFAMSNAAMSGARGNPMPNPFQQWGRPPGLQMGAGQISRSGSSTALGGPGPQSPRVGTNRQSTRNASKRDKAAAKKEEELAQKMPLTAGMDLKPLAPSSSGWKASSIGQSTISGPPLGGDAHMPPDVVQRKVKAMLNKMTPEKFDRIADQILEIVSQSRNETDGRTLRQVIQLTFEKATDEAHWAPMYAKFCKRMLESMSVDIKDENIKDKMGKVVTGGALFRKYLLNRCQEEFERGWKVNLPEKPEGVTEEVAMMSDEYYTAAAAKRRGLGLVKFIGELFKLGMLTERIMHECVKKLLDYEGEPDEAEVESLTSLLRTIGAQLDSSQDERALKSMDVYFQRIDMTIKMESLPSRLRFMLMDVVDLRRAGWHSKDADKGPKTLDEIRIEEQRKLQQAEMERQRNQAQRGAGGRMPMGRGDARNFSYGQMPQPDTSNRIGSEDLRRLGNRAGRNQSSTAGQTFGPSLSLNAGRTNSGPRSRNLGPGGVSEASSRTNTPPAAKEAAPKEGDTSSKNAFSALAGLEEPQAAASPPSTAGSPPVAKSKPATDAPRSKSPDKST
ncbi:MAG: hypothetical protein Q9227_000927 [Pyrenula ochraceoflavens]